MSEKIKQYYALREMFLRRDKKGFMDFAAESWSNHAQAQSVLIAVGVEPSVFKYTQEDVDLSIEWQSELSSLKTAVDISSLHQDSEVYALRENLVGELKKLKKRKSGLDADSV